MVSPNEVNIELSTGVNSSPKTDLKRKEAENRFKEHVKRYANSVVKEHVESEVKKEVNRLVKDTIDEFVETKLKDEVKVLVKQEMEDYMTQKMREEFRELAKAEAMFEMRPMRERRETTMTTCSNIEDDLLVQNVCGSCTLL